MIVTEIVPVDSKTVRIYLDGNFAFQVNKKDFSKYPILECFCQNQTIEEEILQQVYEEILLPRAKEAMLSWLEMGDRSEYEVRKRLKEKEFPEELFDNIISYLIEYHYLDEERLIRSWLSGNAKKKSKRMIVQKLKERGISEEKIYCVMDEEGYEGNEAVICALNKKLSGKTELSWNEKQKVNAHLYRKGFTNDEISYAWNHI